MDHLTYVIKTALITSIPKIRIIPNEEPLPLEIKQLIQEKNRTRKFWNLTRLPSVKKY